jgi:hypothetical protein
VLVTCKLTITGLGCHAGSREDWADEENAMTAADVVSRSSVSLFVSVGCVSSDQNRSRR